MTEGRRCEIDLFDGRKLSILVQPRLLSEELLDIVISHFGLHEKEFFGIWFLDNLKQKRWLRSEKRVLDHSFTKGTPTVDMTFGVRFFVPSITYLKEAKTVELFYLQAVRLISQGVLECDLKTLFLLAAYVMQETNGDYVSESITKSDFKNLSILPEKILREYPSDDECVEKISTHYRRMSGLPRGDAIVNYLSIVERLSMYGTHLFKAKEKLEEMVQLGISHRGIGQYNADDFNAAKELYTWSRIENIFYRDKKFSLEVRNLSRSGSSHSVNSLGRYSTIRQRHAQGMDVVTWYAASASDCREMWSLSVGYHQLYMKQRDYQRDENSRTLKDLARELTQSSSSLALSLDSELSFNSCPEHAEDAYLQVVAALNMRKEMLEQMLIERENHLILLCNREHELMLRLGENVNSTGSDNNGTDTKVGATFLFSEDSLHSPECENEVEKLKRDLKIQNQIAIAAKRLSVEKTVSRKIRKERKIFYKKTLAKLKAIERNLTYFAKKDSNSIQQDTALTTEYKVSQQLPSQSSISTNMAEGIFDEDRLSQNSVFDSNDRQMQILQRSFSSVQPFSRQYSQRTIVSNDSNYFNDAIVPGRDNRSGKYLLGEFGNSGIYSNVLRSHAPHLGHNSANIHGSSSLTLISDSPSSTVHRSSTKAQNKFAAFNATRSRYGRAADEFEEEITRLSHSSKPLSWKNSSGSDSLSSKMQYGNSKFTSVLASAAWSQLSQPPLEKLALDIVSLSENDLDEKDAMDINSRVDKPFNYRMNNEDVSSKTTFV